jgi:hypothetical protein
LIAVSFLSLTATLDVEQEGRIIKVADRVRIVSANFINKSFVDVLNHIACGQ